MSDWPRDPSTSDEEMLGAELPTIVQELTDEQRVERMRDELQMGFDAMRGTARAVSVFGSARIPESHPDYEIARRLGRDLGIAGFTVITGGGPGLMEAANRGAQQARARSVGLNIELPFEQDPNPYQDLELKFHYFFTRKVMFVRYANAFVVCPGGFGTLDEMFESLVLIQTGKIKHFPVVLLGSEYWSGLVDWLREQMLSRALISENDLGLITITDEPAEAAEICSRAADRQLGTSTGSG